MTSKAKNCFIASVQLVNYCIYIYLVWCVSINKLPFQDDNLKYMTALNSIKEVVKPLVNGLELDLDEDIDIKVDAEFKPAVKNEHQGRINGVGTWVRQAVMILECTR